METKTLTAEQIELFLKYTRGLGLSYNEYFKESTNLSDSIVAILSKNEIKILQNIKVKSKYALKNIKNYIKELTFRDRIHLIQLNLDLDKSRVLKERIDKLILIYVFTMLSIATIVTIIERYGVKISSIVVLIIFLANTFTFLSLPVFSEYFKHKVKLKKNPLYYAIVEQYTFRQRLFDVLSRFYAENNVLVNRLLAILVFIIAIFLIVVAIWFTEEPKEIIQRQNTISLNYSNIFKSK